MLQTAQQSLEEPISIPGLKIEQKVLSKHPYPLIARECHEEFRDNLNTATFNIAGVEVSNDKLLIIAGPCAVHSREQTLKIAEAVKKAGAHMLRGGAYKPRTSPYDFQGLGLEGLKILAEARELTGLPIVTEVMDQRLVELVGEYADVLQIGSRNMYNYDLLKEVGKYAAKHDKGVLLKTGLMPKLKEVLCAAEYLAVEGAKKIIICERGINIPTNRMRNTPRPEFLKELRKETFLPIIGDPSHSAGNRELVSFVANQHLSAGANGLILEVIRDDEPLQINGINVCDHKQGLHSNDFINFMESVKNHRVEKKWI